MSSYDPIFDEKPTIEEEDKIEEEKKEDKIEEEEEEENVEEEEVSEPDQIKEEEEEEKHKEEKKVIKVEGKPRKLKRRGSADDIQILKTKPKNISVQKLMEDQERRLENLIDKLNSRLTELDIYKDNQFYTGFYNYYDEKLDYVNNMIFNREYSSLGAKELNDSEALLNETFNRINKAYDSGDYDKADRLINQLKYSVEGMSDDAMKNYLNIQINAEENKWKLKNQKRYLVQNFTDEKLIKAKDIFERTGETQKPIELIMSLLNNNKIDNQTKAQAIQYNNMLMKYAQQKGEQYDTIRGFEDKVNMTNNEEIERKVEIMVNKTRDDIHKIILDYGKNINNKKSPTEIFNKANTLIDTTYKNGLTLLGTRNQWIHDSVANQTEKTDKLNRMNGIKDWFIQQMNSLHQQIDNITNRILIDRYDDKREALINARIENLNKLIDEKKYGPNDTELKNYADYYKNLQVQSEQIQKDINEYLADLDEKIINAPPDEKPRLMNKRREMINQQKEIKEKCNLTTLNIKKNFSAKVPEIINKINNNELMISINQKLNELIPGYNNKEVVSDKKGIVEVNTKDKKKDIRKQISHIIERLKTTKIYLRSNLNLNLDTEYNDEINNLFDAYFDSRINSLTNILSDLEENLHFNSKDKALNKLEKIITSFTELENKLQNCKIPGIYEYYFKRYFEYFDRELTPVKDEFDALASSDITQFGRDSTYELLKSKLQVVKNRMTTYYARYQEKLQKMTDNYNKLLQENRGTSNEQIKGLEKAITEMDIKDLFDAFVEKLDQSYYDEQIDKENTLSAQPSPKKQPEEEKKEEGV